MIKQGIKNFFKNLKYLFTPMGAVALGFVIGLSVFVPGLISLTNKLVKDVKEILSSTSIDFGVLKEEITAAVSALDWSEPLKAFSTMVSVDWLTETLNSCAAALIDNAEVYTQQLTAAVTEFASGIVVGVVALVIFTFLGMLGGFWLTKWLIRREMAKREFWKKFVIAFIDSTLTASVVVLCAYLSTLWRFGALLSFVASLFLYGFISLFEAFISQGRGKVGFKQVVSFKNACKLLALNSIIFAIMFVLVLILGLLLSDAVVLFVGIALIEIAFIVMGLNAEAYVKSAAAAAAPDGSSSQNAQAADGQNAADGQTTDGQNADGGSPQSQTADAQTPDAQTAAEDKKG